MSSFYSQYNTHIIRLENEYEIEKALLDIKVDRKAFEFLIPKMTFVYLKLEKVDTRAANIIKQYLSSIGGEAAISKDAYYFTDRYTDMIISGSKKNLSFLVKKIEDGKYGLSEIAKEIEKSLNENFGVFKIGNKLLDFNQKTYIMGILNLPFNHYFSKEDIKDNNNGKNLLKKIEPAVKAGAEIIEICGDILSNRNSPNNIKDFLPLIISFIKIIKLEYPDILLSIDTSNIEIIKEVLNAGIDIINQTMPLKYNEELIKLIASKKCPTILRHNSINISHSKNGYSIIDVLRDIQSNIYYAISKGIDKDKIIIDPGLGFGKSEKDNLAILKQLPSFRSFNLPILVGLCKHNFLEQAIKGKLDTSLLSTLTANILAIINGANIIKINEVEHISIMKSIIDTIKNNSN